MAPVITALYGALNALFNIFLANNVAQFRRKNKIAHGDDHPALALAIRTHANNAEFVPLALIVMLLVELCGGDRLALHAYGGLLLLARVAHWVGMPRPSPNFFRFTAVAATFTAIVAASIYLLVLRFRITGGI